jgi:hypothetical protein
MTKIETVRERTSTPSQLAGIVAAVVPLGLVAAVWLLWNRAWAILGSMAMQDRSPSRSPTTASTTRSLHRPGDPHSPTPGTATRWPSTCSRQTCSRVPSHARQFRPS